MIGYIYKITNKNNGKFYIGSSLHPDQRFKEHLIKLAVKKHPNIHLQYSYNKHGVTAFEMSVVSTHDIATRQELYAIEEKVLATSLGKQCYNINNKAVGPPSLPGPLNHNYGRKCSPEQLAKRSILFKEISVFQPGDKHILWGVKWTKQRRDKTMAGRALVPHPNQDKPHSQETKDAISAANKEKYKNGFTAEHLQKLRDNSAKSTPILQYSKDGTFIKRWERQNDAATALGCSNSAINICLKGKTKTSAGFIWKYEPKENAE